MPGEGGEAKLRVSCFTTRFSDELGARIFGNGSCSRG